MFSISNTLIPVTQEKPQVQIPSSSSISKVRDEIQLNTFRIMGDSKNISEITEFYNKQFPLSQNSVNHKIKKYSDVGTIVFCLMTPSNNEFVGLIECWDSEDRSTKTLATLAIDEKHRKQGHARVLFNLALDEIKKDSQIKKILVHFRDSKKVQLEKIYQKLGFTGLTEKGNYFNGEIKWEMIFEIL